MEIFSKIYNCYYQVVGQILSECAAEPVAESRLYAICKDYGFGESGVFIVPKLLSGEWKLIEETGKGLYISRLSQMDKLPLTALQKAWLKSLLSEPKICLFLDDEDRSSMERSLRDIEPLYRQEDFYYFDRGQDGDPCEDEGYRRNFRQILKALEKKKPALVLYEDDMGKRREIECAPYRILYSGKEDKFRMEAVKITGNLYGEGTAIYFGRIIGCRLLDKEIKRELPIEAIKKSRQAEEPVLIEISGERNSLDRCMLHFASYEKKTEYDEDNDRYLCSIYYEKQEERELLTQVLSFGPVIRVLGPAHFLAQVKQRVKKQYDLWHGTIE